MENSKKIEKIERLMILTENLRNHIIGYSEFKELKKILFELEIFSKEEFSELLTELEYDSEESLFDKLNSYLTLNSIDKMKTSKFIGSVSGGTISTQLKLIKNFNELKRKRNENT